MRYLKKNNFKWEYLEDAELTGAYDMPELMSVHDVDIHDAVPFNLLRSEKHPENKWGHCYTYDYQFERLWNNAWRYLDLLKRFKGMIGPLLNMPAAQQIWNCWRNKVLTWFFSKQRSPDNPECWIQRRDELWLGIRWYSREKRAGGDQSGLHGP